MALKKKLRLFFLAFCGTQCLAQTPSFQQPALHVASWQQAAGDAQDSASKTASKLAPSSDESNGWEFDIHFGYTIAPHSTGGTGSLPDPSIPSSTSSDLLQPSFFFGGGAAQASAVSTGNGFTPISPYDSALTTAQVQRKNGLSVGFRLGKDVNRWVGLEY